MSLLRRGARVAAISSIHGNVQRRQQQRWAAADQAAAAPAPVAAAPVVPAVPAAPVAPAEQPPAGLRAETVALLTQLGELHAAGVLTDEEFAVQKARLLA
jgi:hypothetical protein